MYLTITLLLCNIIFNAKAPFHLTTTKRQPLNYNNNSNSMQKLKNINRNKLDKIIAKTLFKRNLYKTAKENNNMLKALYLIVVSIQLKDLTAKFC